tara:strand:+ start:384 stop:863 length:480 start_codon:yes stop_codon:yes gene_type:complete
MKKIISHRGNLTGPDPVNENKPWFIDQAIDKGFDVEIDFWLVGEKCFLGHDEPETKISFDFLNDRVDHLWCHAKDITSLQFLLGKQLHCFYHDKDAVTLTSKGFMWTYPGRKLTPRSICLIPERFSTETELFFKDSDVGLQNCYGFCTDFPLKFSEVNK